MNTKTRHRINYNLSFIRFKWWLNPTEKRFKNIGCLCEMCHQYRRSPPGLTPSSYDAWCDECFCELPLWLKFNITTPEELAELKTRQEEAATARRLKREEKLRNQASKTKKKAKLTGFENVEEEDEQEEKKEVEKEKEREKESELAVEEQRQKLELIFNYSDED